MSDRIGKLLARIGEAFKWVERQDMRVGEVWLHPDDVAVLLEDWGAIDRVAQRAVIEAMARPEQGGRYLGQVFGASVYESGKVRPAHVCIVPEGWKVVDPSSCMRLPGEP